jgi:hypothetical protein
VTPLRSRYVTVDLAILGELPAVVEAEDDVSVVLSLALRPPDGLDRAVARGPVRVECISPRGIQRITGTAAWSPASPEELRVTRDDVAIVQRRDTVRVEAVVAATVAEAGRAASAETTTLNLSGTGLLLRDPLELAVGTHVRVLLTMEDGGAPVAITGRVVREFGTSDKGIHIDAISREDQNRLTRFITERQRAALRIARGG